MMAQGVPNIVTMIQLHPFPQRYATQTKQIIQIDEQRSAPGRRTQLDGSPWDKPFSGAFVL